MFKLLVALVIIYIILKVINTRARFADADAARQAKEEQARLAQEEAEEEAKMRSEAVDVDAEVENDWSIEE